MGQPRGGERWLPTGSWPLVSFQTKETMAGRTVQLYNLRDSKVFTGVLNQRIMPWLFNAIPASQAGFLQGRSTEIAILRGIQHMHNHPSAVPLLLDFEKAYDRISHSWLCTVLTVSDFPPGLTELILSINSGNTWLLINNTLSQRIPILSGVKKADPLSPSLFILCMQPFLSTLRHHGIKSQAYTDDKLIFLNGSQDIETVTNIVSSYSRVSGQLLNTGKCSIII